MQIDLENRFIELGTSRNEEKPVIFLIERGIMDNYVFLMKSNLWQTLLDDLGTKPIMLRDKRYDAVFHLVSSAEGLEDVFEANMKERKTFLQVEEARKLEKGLQDAWLGHPNR